jgi:hypothetical protein
MGLIYDLIITSPSLETGVSTDIKGSRVTLMQSGGYSERRAIAACEHLTDAQLKKLQNQRAKTPAERHQQRKAELSRLYEVEVTPDLVEKDDDGWYPQLRLHYYLTLGRGFLTKRDSKRALGQAETRENAVWKPDFNKGQLMSAVLLLEKLNLLQFLQADKQVRGSDEAMQEFKTIVLNFARRKFDSLVFPVSIAAFNQRALRAWTKAGFQQVQTFSALDDGEPFIILMRYI